MTYSVGYFTGQPVSKVDQPHALQGHSRHAKNPIDWASRT